MSARYEIIRHVRNAPPYPWRWTSFGYDVDPQTGELVWVNSADGDTQEEATRELLAERRPT